jgi:hypothetical protein
MTTEQVGKFVDEFRDLCDKYGIQECAFLTRSIANKDDQILVPGIVGRNQTKAMHLVYDTMVEYMKAKCKDQDIEYFTKDDNGWKKEF